MTSAQNLLIVGDGAAGIAAARVIRSNRANDRITLLSDDPQPAYYRAALTNYLSGSLSDEELWALPADAWERLRFERVFGKAVALDTQAQAVQLADGNALRYDRLLIASGTRAKKLQSPELSASNADASPSRPVYTLRTLQDVRQIIETASLGRRAVIIGGGILGIECAHGLHRRYKNMQVTLVHHRETLLEHVVDRRVSAILRMQMEHDGVVLRLGAATKTIASTSRGERITFTTGETLDADLVLVCIGVTPNTEWLANSGITLDKGYVVVDAHMRAAAGTSVWAAGDVAIVRDERVPNVNPGGLWQPAQKQGQVAGLNMSDASGATHTYLPGYLQNATTAWHLNVVTAGEHVDREGEALPPVDETRDGRVEYKRAVLRNGRLVGFMLAGDRREAVALCRLMNLRGSAASVESIKQRLFDPSFDLVGWVAAQEAQPGVQRWKETALIPIGAMPAHLAARTATRPAGARPLVNAKPGLTGLWVAPLTKLTLSFDGQLRSLESNFLRVGGAKSCDIAVPSLAGLQGHLEIAAAGAGWRATPSAALLPIMVNGVSLGQPRFLSDCDVLQVGEWRAVVRLEAAVRLGDTKAESSVSEGTAPSFELLGHKRYSLNSPVTMIGRSSDCHIQLDELTVALTHAQITQVAGAWYLQDCGSTEGTRVNREILIAPRKLAAGDVVEIGSVTLMVRTASRVPSGPEQPATNRTHARSDVYLVCIEGPMAPRALALGLPATIGRGEGADVRIHDPLLSRLHMRVSGSTGHFMISDLGSINGTYVDGVKLAAGVEKPLLPGAKVTLGAHMFRFETREPAAFLVAHWQPSKATHGASQETIGTRQFDINQSATQVGFALTPLDDYSFGTARTEISATGIGPHVVGKAQDANVIRVPIESVSRRHAQIRYVNGQFELNDLGSSNGTFLNGQRLDATPRALKDGDEIRLYVLRFRFGVTRSDAAAAVTTEAGAPSFRFDNWSSNWDAPENPLEADLPRVVAEELDACIGCHMCMRACPLPAAETVTIAALNGYAAGITAPSATVKQFVEDCTQCQKCVPVCPVNIRRSRIVLWNKLKSTPDPDALVMAQVVDRHQVLNLTRAQLSKQLAQSDLFGQLTEHERLRLLASARLRRMANNEVLIAQGQFVDALWIVMEGALAHQDDIALRAIATVRVGDTFGEREVLADAASDVTVRATEESLVLGIQKHALNSLKQGNNKFGQSLDALYLQGSADVALRRCERLQSLTDSQLTRVSAQMRAERFSPRQTIFSPGNAGRLVGVVSRGLVKQAEGAGAAAGGSSTAGGYHGVGSFIGSATTTGSVTSRWEAVTVAEVFMFPAELIGIPVEPQRVSAKPSPTPRTAPAPQNTAKPATQVPPPQQQSPLPCSDSLFLDGMMQGNEVLVIDTKKCVDCNNCVDACARRHGISRLDRTDSDHQLGQYHVPNACFHCDTPLCLRCSVNGIERTSTGEIRINAENCIGCGDCERNCPYDNIQMVSRDALQESVGSPLLAKITRALPDSWQRLLGEAIGESKPESGKVLSSLVASKCDLCQGHDDGPACIRSCPTGAAQRVDPLTFFKKG